MKIAVMAIIALAAFSSIGFAADYNNWGNTDTYQLLGRELTYDQVYVGQARNGVSIVATGTTAITPTYAVYDIMSTSRTITVANGVPGQIVTLVCRTNLDYTLGTATITATTKTGWTSGAMDARKDSITLLYVDDTYGWVIVGTNSITIS